MSTQLSDQDVSAIKALVEKWSRVALDSEWDQLLGLVTDDIVFMPPDQPVVEGKEALRAWAAKFPPVKEYYLTPVQIEGRDDIACVRASFSVTLEPEPGRIVPMKGKGVLTLRKQSDGYWLCVTDIWNFDEAVTKG